MPWVCMVYKTGKLASSAYSAVTTWLQGSPPTDWGHSAKYAGTGPRDFAAVHITCGRKVRFRVQGLGFRVYPKP